MPFGLKSINLIAPLLFAIGFILLTSDLLAAPPPQKEQELWNFENADLEIVVKRVADETGKNFILDPRVQGKITIISQHALTPEEIYQVFLSSLRVLGFKAIEANNVVKIIPQDSANNDNGNVVNKVTQNDDQQVVKVIPLKFISPLDMVNSIREMVPRTSHIVAMNTTNHLIIADTESNVRKVEKIIQQVDNRSTHGVDIIPIKHASATELAVIITNMLREKGGSRTNPITLSPDERTNSLLVSGGTPELRNYLSKVVQQLDSPTENAANSEVIYLKYIQAVDVAPIVATFIEEALATTKEQALREEGKQGAAPTAIANASSQGGNAPLAPPFPEAHQLALKQNAVTGGNQGSLFESNEGKPKSGIINRFVQWEGTTNSLIVKAPPTIMRAIKSIIAKLDIRRPQVIIEVVIAEIDLDRLEEYGVEWNPSPNASVKFGTRFFNTEANPDGSSGGIAGGFSPGSVAELASGITVGVFRHGNLRALIRALATDSLSNILSTPTLVTLDNQTALIKVGEKVPFAVGQTNNQNTGGNPFTSFDREEVGLSLTIKPQIVNANEIKLQIENILSSVIPNSATSSSGGNPTTTERTVVTNVLVNDGRILVLGGLIQDTWSDVKSEVPFLGKLPLVGFLFRKDSKQLIKSNLMIFIRPKIIQDDIAGVRISTDKYDHTRQAQLGAYDALDQYFVDEPVTQPPLSEEDYQVRNKKAKATPTNKPEIILPSPFE
ncbi:MAG: type II secretion system secretin GspD [Candidatus Berkiellales bacterium]